MHEPHNLAQRLRKTGTSAERILWQRLRARQFSDRKWRRQHPVDQYVVDFFCPDLRLVVELDGDVHAFQEEKDQVRQAYLEAQGLRVLRFTNNEVRENLDGVLTVIWEASK